MIPLQQSLNNNDLICCAASGAQGKTGRYVIEYSASGRQSHCCGYQGQPFERLKAKPFVSVASDIYVVNFVDPEQSCTYKSLDYIAVDVKGKVREQDVI